jgi:hypothetical protein
VFVADDWCFCWEKFAQQEAVEVAIFFSDGSILNFFIADE